MLHLSQVLRILAGTAGALCLYAAVFLYEDEQGKIQNRLEALWVSIEGHRGLLIGRHLRLMNRAAELANHALDRVLGEKLISWQVLACSVCYSLASLQAFSLITGELLEAPKWQLFLLFCVSVFLGTLPGFVTSRELRTYVLMLPVTVLLSSAVVSLFGQDSGSLFDLANLDVPILISFVADICFLAATRWSLRWCSSASSLLKIGAVLLVNLSLALLLIASPFFVNWGIFGFVDESTHPALTISAMNVTDAIGCLVVLIVALALLTHRAVWSLVSRPLYALQGLGVARRRSVFGIVGVALLGYAGLGIPEPVKSLIEAAGK